MQTGLTLKQWMTIYKALLAPVHDRNHRILYRRECAACQGDKLRKQAVALMERVISNDAEPTNQS